jgi:hypothetical protein
MPSKVLAAKDFVAEYLLAHYTYCGVIRTDLQHAIFVRMVRKGLGCKGQQ